MGPHRSFLQSALLATLVGLSFALHRCEAGPASLELLSFRGGPSEDILVDGTTAYHLQAGLLSAYDLSNEQEWSVLSRVEISGTGRFLRKFGNLIAVGSHQGLEFIDATDPATLAWTGMHQSPWDSVGFPWEAAGGIVFNNRGFCYADISDPANVVVTPFPGVENYIVGARGSYVYADHPIHNTAIYRIDLESLQLEYVKPFPDNWPQRAAAASSTAEHSTRSGDYMYSVVGGSLGDVVLVTDITTPDNPLNVATHSFGELRCSEDWTETPETLGSTFAAIFRKWNEEDPSHPAGFQGIMRYDFSDPLHPTQLTGFAFPGERADQDIAFGASEKRVAWTYGENPGLLHFGVIQPDGTIDEYEQKAYYRIGGGSNVNNPHLTFSGLAGNILFHRFWPGYTDVSNPAEPVFRETPLSQSFNDALPTHGTTLHLADGDLAIRILEEQDGQHYEVSGFEVYQVAGNEEPEFLESFELEFSYDVESFNPSDYRFQDRRFLVEAVTFSPPRDPVRIYDMRDLDHIKVGTFPESDNYYVDHPEFAQIVGGRMFVDNIDKIDKDIRLEGIAVWNIQNAQSPIPMAKYNPPASDGRFIRIVGAASDRAMVLRETPGGSFVIDVIRFFAPHPYPNGKIMTFVPAYPAIPDYNTPNTAFDFPYLFVNSASSFDGVPDTALECVDLTGLDEPRVLFRKDLQERWGPKEMAFRDGILYTRDKPSEALKIYRFLPTAETAPMLDILLGKTSTPPSHVWDLNGDNQINEADLQMHFSERELR